MVSQLSSRLYEYLLNSSMKRLLILPSFLDLPFPLLLSHIKPFSPGASAAFREA